MKRILDYNGRVIYDNNDDVFLLEDAVPALEFGPNWDLGGVITSALEIEGTDWRGRLHIIIEVEEASDPHP